MFNEKNVSFVNRQKLWNYYNSTLVKAVDVGYNPKTKFYDEDLAKSLKQNIAEFSAFKETSFRKEVESLLTKDGHLTPKSEWKKEALKVSDDYNYRWLETERHQTIANAHMAEKWKDFEQNVELYPNLQLVSVNDARVRPEHKVLDGIIRPFNDPFWKTHTPPLDWGCRCDIIQTDDEVTEVPGGFQTKIEFKNNPGDSGKIFGGSAYEENLSKADVKESKINAMNWGEERIPYDHDKEELKKIKHPKYKKEGNIFVSAYADKSGIIRDKEIAELIHSFDKAEVKIRPKIEIKNFKNPEYLIDGKLSDRKNPTKGRFGSLLKKAKEQGCENIVFDLSDYPYEKTDFVRKLKSNFNDDKAYPLIQDFYIIKDDKVTYITRDQLKKAT